MAIDAVRQEAFRLERVGIWIYVRVSVHAVDHESDGDTGRNEKVAHLDLLGQSAHDGRDAGVEPECFFDAALEILHFGDVLCGARAVRLIEDVIQFIDDNLLLLGVFGDAVEEPGHGRSGGVVTGEHGQIDLFADIIVSERPVLLRRGDEQIQKGQSLLCCNKLSLIEFRIDIKPESGACVFTGK